MERQNRAELQDPQLVLDNCLVQVLKGGGGDTRMLELGDRIGPPNWTPASSLSAFSPSSGFSLPWKLLPAWHGPVPVRPALTLL